MAYGSFEDFERAERFLPENIKSLVRNEDPDINWIGQTDRFWYCREQPDGVEFVRVDGEQDSVTLAFDHERLARGITRATNEDCDASNLPFEEFEYVNGGSAICFQLGGERYECNLSTYECRSVGEERVSSAGTSPDGRWVAFTEKHDLFVRDTEHGDTIRLTSDGTEGYAYATPLPSPVEMVEEGTEDIDQSVEVTWSADSNRLVTYRLDQRSANRFTLVQSAPEDRQRPKQFTYVYPLPGEVGVPVAEPVVFDIERRTKTTLDIDPIPILYFEESPLFEWSEDGEYLYYIHRPRGFKSMEFLKIDAESGESRTLVEGESDTLVDPHMSEAHVVGDGEEIVWSSERSGWHHLYLVDGRSGEVKNPITQGEWVVCDIVRIVEGERRIYFTASGREQDRDPYLRHFYRVDFDGSNLSLLTPEPADHSVELSPSASFFVDTYSRVGEPPITVLRDSDDGSIQQELETADIDQLLNAGWESPEPFKVKAANDETDLYGVMWRPSHFDPSNLYPVVEQIYTGPHDFHVPKTFGAYRSMAQSIAELGFVVVMVDGRGTGGRSKAFRDHSYRNLARTDLADHKAAIEQLGDEHSYMDLSRIGIYGHSAGGYDSTRALFQHPEFYDVAVSSAGNHDHRLDKASWNELWMGYPVDDHYSEQSNASLAEQLDGKLLLIHGELDENVHPAVTRRLVDALIRENKDFDMLVIPNSHHDLDGDPYFLRKRWDYLVEHLHDTGPPKEYEISSYK